MLLLISSFSEKESLRSDDIIYESAACDRNQQAVSLLLQT